MDGWMITHYVAGNPGGGMHYVGTMIDITCLYCLRSIGIQPTLTQKESKEDEGD